MKTYNDFMPQDRQNGTPVHFAAVLLAFLCIAIIALLSLPESALSASDNAPGGASTSFRLIGTIEGEPLIGAVLQDTSGKQAFYQLREKLPDGSQIVHVREDSISLKSEDGTVYDMYITHDTKIAQSSGGYTTSHPVSALSSDENNPVPGVSRRYEISPVKMERIEKKRRRMADLKRRQNRSDE
jgi:hypothetical protein